MTRPILFSPPMVLALLAGRKTQTRRIVKVPKWAEAGAGIELDRTGKPVIICAATGCLGDITCPYGVPGDTLYFREAYRAAAMWDNQKPSELPERVPIKYEADGDHSHDPFHPWGRYRNARFMPKWAARHTRVIADVWCELVQDIGEADAKAEGVVLPVDNDGRPLLCVTDRVGSHPLWARPGGATIADYWTGYFALLWESIHGTGTWKRNDYVWVIDWGRSCMGRLDGGAE